MSLTNAIITGFTGIKSDAKRADVIAYMRTLSDSPVPLPSE